MISVGSAQVQPCLTFHPYCRRCHRTQSPCIRTALAGEVVTDELAGRLVGRFFCRVAVGPDGLLVVRRGVVQKLLQAHDDFPDQHWYRIAYVQSLEADDYDELPLLPYEGLEPLSDGTQPDPVLPGLQPLCQMMAPELSHLSVAALRAELVARNVQGVAELGVAELGVLLHSVLQEAARQAEVSAFTEEALEAGQIDEAEAGELMRSLELQAREVQESLEPPVRDGDAMDMPEEGPADSDEHSRPSLQFGQARDAFNGKQEYEMVALEEEIDALDAIIGTIDAAEADAERRGVVFEDEEGGLPPPPPAEQGAAAWLVLEAVQQREIGDVVANHAGMSKWGEATVQGLQNTLGEELRLLCVEGDWRASPDFPGTVQWRPVNGGAMAPMLLLSVEYEPMADADVPRLLVFEQEDDAGGHLNSFIFSSSATRHAAVYELHLATAARDLAVRDLGGPCSPRHVCACPCRPVHGPCVLCAYTQTGGAAAEPSTPESVIALAAIDLGTDANVTAALATALAAARAVVTTAAAAMASAEQPSAAPCGTRLAPAAAAAIAVAAIAAAAIATAAVTTAAAAAAVEPPTTAAPQPSNSARRAARELLQRVQRRTTASFHALRVPATKVLDFHIQHLDHSGSISVAKWFTAGEAPATLLGELLELVQEAVFETSNGRLQNRFVVADGAQQNLTVGYKSKGGLPATIKQLAATSNEAVARWKAQTESRLLEAEPSLGGTGTNLFKARMKRELSEMYSRVALAVPPQHSPQLLGWITHRVGLMHGGGDSAAELTSEESLLIRQYQPCTAEEELRLNQARLSADPSAYIYMCISPRGWP